MTTDPHQWPEPTRESLLAQLRESRVRDRAGEQTPTADLTAILAEHDDPPGWTVTGADDALVYECSCGDLSPALDHEYIDDKDAEAAGEWHRAHVAEQITAAGFGPVRAVEAERDAAEFKFEHAHKGANLYRERAEQAEVERDALRERLLMLADDIRQEQPEYRTPVAHGRIEVVERFRALLDASPDEDGASDPQCLICRRPEREHRDRNGHGFAPDREDGAS